MTKSNNYMFSPEAIRNSPYTAVWKMSSKRQKFYIWGINITMIAGLAFMITGIVLTRDKGKGGDDLGPMKCTHFKVGKGECTDQERKKEEEG